MLAELKKARIEILLLFAMYLFIMPRVYKDFDMAFWGQWALYIHRHGLSNAYGSGTNYLPVPMYILYLFDLLQGTDLNILHNINYIKIFFLIFDFLPIFILCCFSQKILSFKIPYLWLLLNIAYMFNSLVWGQIDGIYTNFAFLAIIIGLLYPAWGIFLYTLALNTKPQAIEFAPVIALVLWYSTRNWKALISLIGIAVITQMLLLLPFMGSIKRLIDIATHAVDLYNKLSISAFNIWYIIEPGNPYFIDDKSIYFLLSYKTIGLTLFAVSGFLVLIPMARKLYHDRLNNKGFSDGAYQLLFLGTGMFCLYFFYFNTQMHERYAHPIIILFFFYGVVSKNYKLYILASIPYFLSLDKAFTDYLPIVHYKIIFASRIIAIWYTFTVIYGSYLFYHLLKRKRNEEILNPKGLLKV